jgi:hypothetical protein
VRPVWLSQEEYETARDYLTADPDDQGNLHERMKFVIERGSAIEVWKLNSDLWWAIIDLETEVSCYAPGRFLPGRQSNEVPDYGRAKPILLGNLHERMQALMFRARTARLAEVDEDLWQAILTLESEVARYAPARPPYARRGLRYPPLLPWR